MLTVGRQAQPTKPLPNYLRADLREPATLTPLLQQVDCVIHAAGLAHQFGAAAKPAAFFSINVDATTEMMRAAVNAGVQHLILLSSVSVYGGAATDETFPCKPQGPYAESKYLAEQHARVIAAEADQRLTILRLATCYGEGDPGNVKRLMQSIDRGRFVWIGTGANRKSLIHRGDVARAVLAVVASCGSGITTYNVAAAPCTMHEIVQALAAALGRRVPSWHVPGTVARGLARVAATATRGRGKLGALPTTIEKWLADDVYGAAAFEQAFGFRAAISVAEGLRREVAWYKAQANAGWATE